MSEEDRNKIREQAEILAQEGKKSEPGITKIYWFPHDSEVRLIQLDDMTPICISGEVEAFYFDPTPEEGITAPSGIAIIRSDEFGKLALPADWGDWEDGEELVVQE